MSGRLSDGCVLTRLIQCDEKRPCSSCVKHEVPCSLIAVPPAVDDAVRGDRGSGVENSDRSAVNSVGSCASPRRQDRPSYQQARLTSIRNLIQSLSGEVDMLAESEDTTSQATDHYTCHKQYLEDLRLMHHFTTSAALTVTDDPSLREAWQIAIPNLSFSCVSLAKCR